MRMNPQSVCLTCRTPIHAELLPSLARRISVETQSLKRLAKQLPLGTADRYELVHELVFMHDFIIDDVEDTISGMLSDGILEEVASLSHAEKERIFKDARAPAKRIQDEIFVVQEELKRNPDEQNKSYIASLQLWRELRVQLSEARVKARDEIFRRINSADVHSAGDRHLSVDLHCMYAHEAIEKFNTLVVPILPAIKKMLIITGKGSHSANNVGVLRKVIIELVESVRNREHMRWEAMPDNEGALWVHWRDV
jgi:DNA-nicking Smr family endonuclease